MASWSQDALFTEADPLDRGGLHVLTECSAQDDLVLGFGDVRAIVGVAGVRLGGRLVLPSSLILEATDIDYAR